MHNLLYICTYLLNILQERYTQELKKIHGPEPEDPRLVHFNIDAAYASSGGTPHEGMSKYQLFSVNYCQFVTLSFLQACFGRRGCGPC
jgi:hypothetical protein